MVCGQYGTGKQITIEHYGICRIKYQFLHRACRKSTDTNNSHNLDCIILSIHRTFAKSNTFPCYSEYADYLRKLYATYLGSVPDKLPFTLGKEYVTLTLVKNEKQTQTKADEFIQTQSSGNVTKILSEREEIKVEDILTKGEKTHFVSIEGEPGIGKSTLTIELCHQ